MFNFRTTFLYSDDVGHTCPGRIGALWQQRMETMREYEVVRDGNVFGTSFSHNVVFSSDYERAHNHLDILIEKSRKSRSIPSFRALKFLTNAASVFR